VLATTVKATALEAESALLDELREHAVRPANASNNREVNFVIDLER